MSQAATINIVGATQGAFCDVFIGLRQALLDSGIAVGRTGAYVSFARHFASSKAVAKATGEISYLKEWELFERARTHRPDYARLREYERRTGPAALWEAVVCDRRLSHGRAAKFQEDYNSSFGAEFIDALLDLAIIEIERLLDAVQPNLVLGFVPVTFGESLLLALARSRRIPTLFLRTVKIGNHNALHDRLPDISQHFIELLRRPTIPQGTRVMAAQFLEDFRSKGLIYEGVAKPGSTRLFDPLRAVRTLPGVLMHEAVRQCDAVQRRDNHDYGYLMPWYYNEIARPWRNAQIERLLQHSGRVLTLDQVGGHEGGWAFFPLHSEPEIALQVFGRPYYKDQTTLLRALAASLPAGMRLLVKEHPRSAGYRSLDFIRALLAIPNLYFVDQSVPSRAILDKVDFVAVISGVIASEAVFLGKPALVLGYSEISHIGGQMAWHCHNLFDLPRVIGEMLATFRYDEEKVLSFIAALIDGSVGIDVYSVLLKKSGRVSFGDAGGDAKARESESLKRLSEYTLQRWRYEQQRLQGI